MAENEMLQGRGSKKEEIVIEDVSKGLPWAGTAKEVNTKEDAWDYGAPPPLDFYKVQLALFEAKLVKPKADESTWYYVVNIEGRTVENKVGDYNGAVAFVRVSTRRGRGKAISTAEGAIVKLGYGETLQKASGKLTDKMIAEFLIKILAKAPVTTWELDWRAGYVDKKEKFHTVCSTYADFPDDPEKKGQKLSRVRVTTVDGGMETVNAQLNMIQWVGKGESPKSKASAVVAAGDLDLEIGEVVVGDKGPNSAPRVAAPAEIPTDELEL